MPIVRITWKLNTRDASSFGGSDDDWQVSGDNVFTGHGGDYPSGNVGIGNTSPQAKLDVSGGILSTGTTGATPVSGAGTRMMWIPSKYAFRAGRVTGNQWDASNIGSYSVGFGYNSKASTSYSTVSGGKDNIASGTYSSVGGGVVCTATGLCAVVSGGHTGNASADYSFVGGGKYNTASNGFSVVVGGESNNLFISQVCCRWW